MAFMGVWLAVTAFLLGSMVVNILLAEIHILSTKWFEADFRPLFRRVSYASFHRRVCLDTILPETSKCLSDISVVLI